MKKFSSKKGSIVTVSDSNVNLKLSEQEWRAIGAKAGWKTAQTPMSMNGPGVSPSQPPAAPSGEETPVRVQQRVKQIQQLLTTIEQNAAGKGQAIDKAIRLLEELRSYQNEPVSGRPAYPLSGPK